MQFWINSSLFAVFVHSRMILVRQILPRSPDTWCSSPWRCCPYSRHGEIWLRSTCWETSARVLADNLVNVFKVTRTNPPTQSLYCWHEQLAIVRFTVLNNLIFAGKQLGQPRCCPICLRYLRRRLWQDFGKTLARLWQDFGKTLARLWQDFGCFCKSTFAIVSILKEDSHDIKGNFRPVNLQH
jgi:hypothetical protein